MFKTEVKDYGRGGRIQEMVGGKNVDKKMPTPHIASQNESITIRFNSIGVLGPRLFNHLLSSIRNMSGCSVDTFKRALNQYLDTIPDEPRVPKLVKFCSKGSNSLIEY